jgi:hypothetical protein
VPTLAEIQAKFTDQLQHVDDVVQIVLKGHLVIEELMTESIEHFLFHKEFLEQGRFQFHQKLLICRAMSVSDHNNPMWNLLGSINSLRNHLSHSLDSAERAKRIESLNSTFSQQFPDHLPENLDPMPKEAAICMLAISGALGYLHAHYEEVRRFKGVVLDMDKIMNKRGLSEA